MDTQRIIYDSAILLNDDELKINAFRSELINIVREKAKKERKENISGFIPAETGSDNKGISTLTAVEKLSYRILRIFGAGFVGFSLIYLFYLYQPVISENLANLISNNQGNQTSVIEKTVQAEGASGAVEEARNYGINPTFSIYIAKVKAKGNIIANVDITDTDSYLNVLKEGVAHARGSNFPGQGKNIYLFSHSTNSSLNVVRFNAIFNDLGKLEKGDLITIFYSDKKYLYSVDAKFIVASDDVTFLDKDFGGESLILQTCYPPGTTLKRLLIVAKPVDN